MKIVLAFDSFKGCMSAAEACSAAAMAIHQSIPQATTIEIPLSDGGEGLVDCVKNILPTKIIEFQAHGPLMEPIKATYALSLDHSVAYMEMAATSGLTLVSQDKRNPLLTTTYGVGDMINDAILHDCKKIVMGIGGSATNDGGKGMISSLKHHGLLDKNGQPTPSLTSCKFLVACDVNNPLCGKNGASYVFGPQKGATPVMVEQLDTQLALFAQETVEAGLATPELSNYPGTGAAGGLGYGMIAYLKAELLSGIEVILDIVNFDSKIEKADIIITGEGKSDAQTLMGKLPQGVLKRAQARNIPVWLLSGCIDDTSCTLKKKFQLVQSINQEDDRELNVLMRKDVAQSNIGKTIKKLLESFI